MKVFFLVLLGCLMSLMSPQAESFVHPHLPKFGGKAEPPPPRGRVSIGKIEVSHNWFSPDDYVVVQRVFDPKIRGVACYISVPRIGGFKSFIRAQKIPYHYSIHCVRSGPVEVLAPLPPREDLVSAVQNVWMRIMRMTRIYDESQNTAIYVIWASHLVKGSTDAAIAAVPLSPGAGD